MKQEALRRRTGFAGVAIEAGDEADVAGVMRVVDCEQCNQRAGINEDVAHSRQVAILPDVRA